jgi:hypothetical protein
MLNLYLLIMYGSYTNQKFNPNFYGIIAFKGMFSWAYPDGGSGTTFEAAFIIACSTANLVGIILLLNSILFLVYNVLQHQFLTVKIHTIPLFSESSSI